MSVCDDMEHLCVGVTFYSTLAKSPGVDQLHLDDRRHRNKFCKAVVRILKKKKKKIEVEVQNLFLSFTNDVEVNVRRKAFLQPLSEEHVSVRQVWQYSIVHLCEDGLYRKVIILSHL